MRQLGRSAQTGERGVRQESRGSAQQQVLVFLLWLLGRTERESVFRILVESWSLQVTCRSVAGCLQTLLAT